MMITYSTFLRHKLRWMTRSSSVGSSRLQFLILQFLFSSTEEKETKEKRLITAGYQVEGLIFFKFQYNLYMSDTLVSDAMTSSTGSEEHQSSMMFKPVNDIQSRLGKVLLTKTKTCTHTRNDQKSIKPSPASRIRLRLTLSHTKYLTISFVVAFLFSFPCGKSPPSCRLCRPLSHIVHNILFIFFSICLRFERKMA